MPKKFTLQQQEQQKQQSEKKIRKQGQKLGRPQQQSTQDTELQNQILQKYWFGDEKATQLITFFIQQGNLVVKCKTGIPASKDKNLACSLSKLKKEESNIKPFRKRYIRELKIKISNILQYFGYNQQCLLLSKNDEQQQFDDQGSYLTSILQFLDPKFIKSYYLLTSIFEFCQEQNLNQDDYIRLFHNEVMNDQDSHKMLLDLQAIKFLLKEDFDLFEKIKDPYQILSVLELSKSKYKVPTCNLESKEVQDKINISRQEGEWIKDFAAGFYEILSH